MIMDQQDTCSHVLTVFLYHSLPIKNAVPMHQNYTTTFILKIVPITTLLHRCKIMMLTSNDQNDNWL